MQTRIIFSSGVATTLLLAGCSSQVGAADASTSTPIVSAAAPSASAAASSSPVVLENCGQTVTVQHPPTRAVALDQTAAEILIGLGVADRVVGTGYESDAVPADIADVYNAIPQLSGRGQPISHEALLAAQPDFVYSLYSSFFVPDQSGDRAELQALGVPAYLSEFDCTTHAAVDGISFDMLFDEYRDLAKIFGVPEAGEKLVAQQQAVLDQGLAAAKKVTGSPSLMWFYSTYDGLPYAAGPGGIPQLVTDLVGARNVFDDASTKWPEVSWDEIAARNPDVIVLADLTRGRPGDTAEEKIAILKSDPLTSTMDAVKNDRFIVVPGRDMDPSIGSVAAVPAVAEGLAELG